MKKYQLSLLILLHSCLFGTTFPTIGLHYSGLPPYMAGNPVEPSQRVSLVEPAVGNWGVTIPASHTGDAGGISAGSISLIATSNVITETAIVIGARSNTRFRAEWTLSRYSNSNGSRQAYYSVGGGVVQLADITSGNASGVIDLVIPKGSVLKISARTDGGSASLGLSNFYVQELDDKLSSDNTTLIKQGNLYTISYKAARKNNSYLLQRSYNLIDWIDVTNATIASSDATSAAPFNLQDGTATSDRVFYRIKRTNE